MPMLESKEFRSCLIVPIFSNLFFLKNCTILLAHVPAHYILPCGGTNIFSARVSIYCSINSTSSKMYNRLRTVSVHFIL